MTDRQTDDNMLSVHLWDMADYMAKDFLKDLKVPMSDLPELEQSRFYRRLSDLLLEFGMEARLGLMNEQAAKPKFADGDEEEDERSPHESEMDTRMAQHARDITQFVKECGDQKDDPDLRVFYLVIHHHLIRIADEVRQALITAPRVPKRISPN